MNGNDKTEQDKTSKKTLVERAGEALARVRARRPFVMCLTNTVVANETANALLALGAQPAMVEEPEEAGELARTADALLVNVGTLTRFSAEAMRRGIAAATAAGRPWVLDPVAVDRLDFRRRTVLEFLALRPRLVRGNAREIEFLLNRNALDGLPSLATGATDAIRDATGRVALTVANGTEALTRVTGTGCIQGALAAAFCAVESDPLVAATATALVPAIAGERAAEGGTAPGSFAVRLIDALAELSPDDLLRTAKASND